jgi:hypothetical protein
VSRATTRRRRPARRRATTLLVAVVIAIVALGLRFPPSNPAHAQDASATATPDDSAWGVDAPNADSEDDAVATGSDNCDDACDAPTEAPPTETPIPEPTESTTWDATAPSMATPPSGVSTSPTPVTLGPDDPSLFGWPTTIGGTPLWLPPEVLTRYPEREVVARINAGGPAVTTGGDVVWEADAEYTGGASFRRRAETEITGTDDDAIFRTERRSTVSGGRFSYAIPVTTPGTYRVRLFFVASSSTDGGRVLNVNMEGGTRELDHWDLHAQGTPPQAVVEEFDVWVDDGTLDIVFDGVTGRAAVAAIEVLGPPHTAGETIVNFALRYLGYPYVWATAGPDSFDCSGFTDWVVSHVLGIHIGYNQLEQIVFGTAVELPELQPGDLVFFANTHPVLEGVSHVGIYIGNGQFVHASSANGVVTINDLTGGYYADHYYGAVRLV